MASPAPLLAVARQTPSGPVVSFVFDSSAVTTDVAHLQGDADGSIARMDWSAGGSLALAGKPTGTGVGIYVLDPAVGRLTLVGDAANPGCTTDRVDAVAWAGDSILFTAAHEPATDECMDAFVRVDPGTGARAHVGAASPANRWAVSPDGGAVAHDDDEQGLSITDLGTGASRVVGGLEMKTTPAWSPEGTQVLHVDSGPDGQVLVTAPRDPSGTAVDLTAAAVGLAGFSHVGWGADATTVFFRSWQRDCHTGCDGFYRLAIPTGTLTKVLTLPDMQSDAWMNNFGYLFDWSISPDGTLIAYDLTPAPGNLARVFVVDAAGASAPIEVSGEGANEDAMLLGWVSPGVVGYRVGDGLVMAQADGSGLSGVTLPGMTAVALASRSMVNH